MVAKKATKRAKPKAPAGVAVTKASKVPAAGFPIVGVGASAGGLDAFERFFRHIPSDSGMAFVLVPHLDPGHASILTEILQRSTDMPVHEVKDQVPVAPNHVYIIPPNRDMAIFQGVLYLSIPEQARGLRMPIDAFLRSLADDRGEQSIGVILSGTGTDGTLGLRAIIGAGGFTLVQDPTTAKYDGMPNSAIQAGYATHVLPVEKMPEVLLGGIRALAAAPQEAPQAPEAVSGIGRILLQLRSATGHDFSQYKESTINRRVERRMSQHGIKDKLIYARYLKEHPAESQALFKELLINVTSFFRDPEAFVALKNDILPHLLGEKPQDYVVRCWVIGCATGEEAYSIAMLLREYMDEARQDFKLQIYATDLDEDAITLARTGLYPPNIGHDVSPERLRRFFSKEGTGYRVKKDIREMVVFAVQNAIKDPPFTRLDLLCCRNLMIYLDAETQNRLIPVFHYALKAGGVLFLSPSESIGKYHDLFAPLNRKWKIYVAIPSLVSKRAIVTGAPTWTGPGGGQAPGEVIMKKPKEINFAELSRQMLLQSYVPPSVVTDLKGDILFVHGDTGAYLRPAPGQATLNLVEMAREGLQQALRVALQTAVEGALVADREVSVKTDGKIHKVTLSVRPLSTPDVDQRLLLVSFREASAAAPAKPKRSKRTAGPAELRRIEELESELALAKENLHVSIEEHQASNEEIKSTNEELQSTNEELQSTNEELETSKEELQSVNEELLTVNAELQTKIEQLTSVQNDMKNLLDNVSVGIIFLDDHLIIRRFTRDAARIYRLISSDVGRPLADINADIFGNDLLTDAQGVLESLVPCEREMHAAAGAYFLARIQPYRTTEDVLEGVVLTFTDISRRVGAETALVEARTWELAQNIVDTVREPLIVLDGDLKVVTASRSFYEHFRVAREETVGRLFYELGNRQWDIPALRRLLEDILPHDEKFDGFVVEHDFPLIGHRKMLLNARRVVGEAEGRPLILLAAEEIP